MKKFLKNGLIFVFPLLLVLVPLEILLREVPNPYKYKYEWMQKNAPEVETLVLGSSHAFYGIRPEFLDGKAFSLANVAQEFQLDSFLINYWSDKYTHLKTVICPVSFFSWFDPGIEKGKESYRCRYYKIYMDCDLYSSISYNFELSHLSSCKYKFKKIFADNPKAGCDEFGWGNEQTLARKNKKAWKDGSDAAKTAKHHKRNIAENYRENYERMRNIALFCQNKGIRLILVTTPAWHDYFDKLDQEQLLKMYELTHKLQKEFNLPYLDYLKSPLFGEDDFFDADHLSDVGAEKFTKILNRDISMLKR